MRVHMERVGASRGFRTSHNLLLTHFSPAVRAARIPAIAGNAARSANSVLTVSAIWIYLCVVESCECPIAAINCAA